MDFHRRRLIPCLTAAALAVGALGATSAQAAKDVYPADVNAQSLNAGLAGYTNTVGSEGLCVPLLLCPAISNEYRSTGGVDNTGYITTRLGALLGVGATSEGVFTSPTFTYDGVDGKPADTLRVKLASRSDVGALLQVAGNSATYSVDLVEVNGGGNVSAISSDSLSGLSSFTEKSVEIDPSSLDIGSKYRIRITSRFTSGAQVIPGGSADYDNISVEASAASTGGGGGGAGDNPGGGGGGGGHDGGNGGNGGTGLGGKDGFGGNGAAGSATLKGNQLIVKTRCKRSPSGTCKINLQAMLAKKGPTVSKRKAVSIKPGKKASAKLTVKGKFLADLTSKAQKGDKIVLKQKVKKGGKSAKGFKAVKVKLAS